MTIFVVENGRFHLAGQTEKGETYGEILKRHGLDFVEGTAQTHSSTREGSQKSKKKDDANSHNAPAEYSYWSFGAQFARVLVDPGLGTVRVTHCVGVMDIGKVLNLKTAKNQIMGGMIFSLGMALMEESIYDPNRGRIVTRDLANYLVPVHADIPEIDVQFIDKPDPHITAMGARGIGEIGITGMAAAIANAVYHATGQRIRDLPITPEKILGIA